MLLTYKQAQELLQAHSGIDQAIVTAEGSGEVRVKVAHNLKQLKGAVQTAMETRKKIFTELTGGKNKVEQDDPLAQEIGMRMEEIDKTEVELKLWRIPYNKLKPDQISPQLINSLWEILVGVPELGEPDA